MNIGSLVVTLPSVSIVQDWAKPLVKWLPAGDEETIYTIREILRDPYDNGECVRLEEGVIGYGPTGSELALDINDVREVQPPMDLSLLIEEVIHETV